MLLEQIVFYVFAITLMSAAVMVVTLRNPVKAALALVLAFFASAGLWILLEAEFLALVLIFVYVGAVVTLFLFVVMMIDIDMAELRRGFVRYLPLGGLVVLLLVAMMAMVIGPEHFGITKYAVPLHETAGYSNTKALGNVLYTDYVYPFEIAGVLLLVAMISAITLTFRGKQRRKSQTIPQQIKVRKKDRLRIVKMPSEK